MQNLALVLKITLVLAAIGAVVLVLLAHRFSTEIAARDAALAATPPAALRNDLPDVLAAFATRGLLGASPAGAIRLHQAAEMRLKKGADWQALPAQQTIAAARPGFAWVAAKYLGPLPLLRVLDSFDGDDGRLALRLFGGVPMGGVEGPEAALGEGLRYLAELPWCPDAILTNRAITWQEGPDGLTARLPTAGGDAVVSFGLGPTGDITTIEARNRPASQPDGSIAHLDWHGRFWDYADIGGRRVPRQGEIGYVHADGYEAYFRAEITGYAVLEPPTPAH